MGSLSVAAAAVLWAVGGTFARTLIDRGASPLELTEARGWVAALAGGLYLVVARRTAPLRRRTAPPGRRTGPLGRARRATLLVFGLSVAAANLTYYLAIASLPVAVAVVIQYTAGGLVVLWSWAVARRRPSPPVLVGLALALGGVVLVCGLQAAVLGGRPSLPAAGLAAAAGSSVSFAAYMVAGERLAGQVGPVRAVAQGFVVAAALWAALQAPRGVPQTLTDPALRPGVLFLGVVTTVVPFVLFVWGLARIEASRAGVVSMLEPLAAALLGWWWLGQALTPLQAAGGAMVVAGVAAVQSRR